MKKIVNLILVIVAFATVNTVDAKQIKKITPESTKTELKNMIEDSKPLLNPAIDTAAKKEIAAGLLQDIEAVGLTKYAKLLIKRKKIANELEAARAERDTFKTGWLWNSAEWHEADKKVGELNTKLRNKNKKIRDMEMQQPKEQTNTIKYVVAGVVATIGILAAEYYLRPEGYMRTLLGHKVVPPTIELTTETLTPPVIEPAAIVRPLPTTELAPIEPIPTKPLTQAEKNRAANLQRLKTAEEKQKRSITKKLQLRSH